MLDDVMTVNTFSLFWASTTPSVRGAWTDSTIGRGQAKRFRNEDIRVRIDFLKEDEIELLLNLCQSCEGFFGFSPTGSRHELDRIEQVMEAEPFYASKDLGTLIRSICGDMLHLGATRSSEVALERRYMAAVPAEKRSENGMLDPSQWILWLNNDYKGGEVFFPTRRIVVPPLAGAIIRWPMGIPFGIATAHEGYQFTLSGISI